MGLFLLQLYCNDNCHVESHENHNEVPDVGMPLNYTFYLSCIRAWRGTELIRNLLPKPVSYVWMKIYPFSLIGIITQTEEFCFDVQVMVNRDKFLW